MVEACRHGGIPLLPGKGTCMACGIFLRRKVLQRIYLVLNKKQSPKLFFSTISETASILLPHFVDISLDTS
ncbi:hypothetical protein D3C87_995530 [compost metagenome]